MGNIIQLNHIYRRRDSRGIDGERYAPASPSQPTIEVKGGTVDIYVSNAPATKFLNSILGTYDLHPVPPFEDSEITVEMSREPEGPLDEGVHTICSKTTWIAFVPVTGTPQVREACVIDTQFELERELNTRDESDFYSYY